MLVELNNEAIDGIIQSILIQDYKGLIDDNKRLSKVKDKASFQIQDIEHNLRYIDAMETLMEYYVGFDWKEKI